ncbi:MAG: Clp protease N-terminal domain-containing protein [Acidimicrobiia bacterium]
MFERFTPQARSTVLLAQEEARSLGHGYIGTEHLLLALLAEPGTAAAQVLTALGADQAEVRDEILSIVGPGEGAPSGHIPFTPRAKKVLELALREALALKHRSIAGEHILLGLVREGEGLAALILTKHGIELEQLRRQVIDRLGGGLPRRGPFLRGRFAPTHATTVGGSDVVDRAVALARDEPVASHHYLRALVEDPDSAAARTLAALGVTREAVEAKLAEMGTAGTTDAPAAPPVGAGQARLAVEGDLVLVELAEPDLARRLRPFLGGPLADLPGLQAVWAATMPAVANVVDKLEAMPGLNPPGWTEAGVAALAVTSLPDRPVTRIWYRPGTDPEAVTTWLAEWLRRRTTYDEGNYLTVALDRVGEEIVLSGYSAGIAPGAPHWPVRPLAALVAAALAALEPAG